MYLGIDIGGTRLKAGLVDDQGRLVRFEAGGRAGKPGGTRTGPAVAHPSGGGRRAPAWCRVRLQGRHRRPNHRSTAPAWAVGIRRGPALERHAGRRSRLGCSRRRRQRCQGFPGRRSRLGRGAGQEQRLLLTLGTGIGGAILADGRLVRGASDVAGHLGHLTADPNGPPCLCGNIGCLETVFSARAIEADAWSAMHQGCASPMCGHSARPSRIPQHQIRLRAGRARRPHRLPHPVQQNPRPAGAIGRTDPRARSRDHHDQRFHRRSRDRAFRTPSEGCRLADTGNAPAA